MNTIHLDNSLITPSKIICVGRNYVEHIEELNNEIPIEPVIFLKPNSAINQNLLSGSDELHHYEGEICFLIKNNTLHAVGVGLDITKRQLQSKLKEKGLPWERAKAFDGSAVFTDFIQIKVSITSLIMELLINDQLVQEANYDLMIYKPETLLSNIQAFMSCEDGDIIMTGTPKGVGTYTQGDHFEIKLFSADKLLIKHSWQAV